MPVGAPPVDGVPVGVSFGSVYRTRVPVLHLTFPSVSNLHYVLRVIYQSHVSSLAAWVSLPLRAALSIRLCLPVAFRLTAFASWLLLLPLGIQSLLRLTYYPAVSRRVDLVG